MMRERLWRFALDRARPLDLLRLRMGRDLDAHDLRPTGDQFGGGKTLLSECAGERLAQEISERTCWGLPGLVHAVTLCHIGAP